MEKVCKTKSKVGKVSKLCRFIAYILHLYSAGHTVMLGDEQMLFTPFPLVTGAGLMPRSYTATEAEQCEKPCGGR